MADRAHVVLRVRRILEQRAIARAAEAEAELATHLDTVRRRAKAHDERPVGTGTLTPLQLRALQLQGMASWTHLAEARQAADRAARVRGERDEERRARVVDRRASERMVERREQEVAAVAAATAQRALDDLAVLRWGRA